MRPAVDVAVSVVQEIARRDEAVRVLALVGSQARGSARRDSDVDFVLLTDKPERWSTIGDSTSSTSSGPPFAHQPVPAGH